jgi:hypothetical protein
VQPLDFVLALVDDAQHADVLAADALFLRRAGGRAAAASLLVPSHVAPAPAVVGNDFFESLRLAAPRASRPRSSATRSEPSVQVHVPTFGAVRGLDAGDQALINAALGPAGFGRVASPGLGVSLKKVPKAVYEAWLADRKLRWRTERTARQLLRDAARVPADSNSRKRNRPTPAAAAASLPKRPRIASQYGSGSGGGPRRGRTFPVRTLAECLASDNFSILEKWTLEHASKPYPTSQEKQKLAERCGLELNSVHTWFRNMRKRKFLHLEKGSRPPADAFETQLLAFMRADGLKPPEVNAPTPTPRAPRSRGSNPATLAAILTGESSDDEVGSLPDGGVAAMPSLARGTLSRPRAPPRSDPTPEVATEPEPAAEPEPEPGPASWVQCVACDKWRVVDADTAVLAASSSWTCADGGVTCSKMACSADNPDCECHRRDWDREVLLVSPTGCVLARYCSPRGAGAVRGMSKVTVERYCNVSASKTQNVFRYASGFKAELLRYEVSATMDRMIAEVSRVDDQPTIVPTAPQKRRRVHRQRPPADSETANAATRSWRDEWAHGAPPVPFAMPPPSPH